MSLADHLPTPTPRGPTCTVAAIRDRLDDTDRHTLDAWLADRAIASSRIIQGLRAASPLHVVSRGTVDRHRRQECGCDQ